mmetsp:Transcript_8826/g.32543  ORF Transcript_8826/g.32543 Transcript_8826/m.32543 type:complete len:154 (-) Transcript_8826:1611-2072(-)|eukprot:scaffold7429_cov417-Prasinococcus_capsulatus_cf.AAC.10
MYNICAQVPGPGPSFPIQTIHQGTSACHLAAAPAAVAVAVDPEGRQGRRPSGRLEDPVADSPDQEVALVLRTCLAVLVVLLVLQEEARDLEVAHPGHRRALALRALPVGALGQAADRKALAALLASSRVDLPAHLDAWGHQVPGGHEAWAVLA